jgi:hypothetical protein
MWAAKIYALVWLLTAAFAGIAYFTGYINEITTVIFGFVFSTLIFMGIVAVLPFLVNEHYAPKY